MIMPPNDLSTLYKFNYILKKTRMNISHMIIISYNEQGLDPIISEEYKIV